MTRIRQIALTAAGFAWLLPCQARAIVFATVTVHDMVSYNASGASVPDSIFTYTFSGLSQPRTLRVIDYSGTVQRVEPTNTPSANRVTPTGLGFSNIFEPVAPNYSGTPPRSSAAGVWDVSDTVVSNGTTLTFQFWTKTVVGPLSVQAVWRTFNFAFDDNLTTPVSQDLGIIAGAGTTTLASQTINSGSTPRWYKFTVIDGVSLEQTLQWLDIKITPSGAAPNTEMALYSADGVKIAEDDDSGTGVGSALSFGLGSGTTLNPGDPTAVLSTGQSGASLGGGTYFIAVANFNSTFANGFQVTGGTTNTSAYSLSISSGVPEPTSVGMILFAFGTLSLSRRR